MKRIFPMLVALVFAGCGTDVTGPSASLLSCVYGESITVAPGQTLNVEGAENQSVCLRGAEGAEYLYIPFYAATGSGASEEEIDLFLTGAGLTTPGSIAGSQSVARPPSVFLGTSREQTPRVRRGYAVHDRLRHAEIRELGPRILPGPARPSARAATAAEVPSVGDLRDFNVSTSCDGTATQTGEVVYVSQHAIVVADTANPVDLSPADYAYFGETFDTLVYPVETTHFGEPTDIDANQRSILFFTRAVNELNPYDPADPVESITIGFFWAGDLFPPEGSARLQACPASNESEMFYLIAPDPDHLAGHPITLEQVQEQAIPLIGHEFQHLINASRRLFVNNASEFEAAWLNEGLSHAAEELLFLDVSGLATGGNLDIEQVRDAGAVDAFNEYMGGNAGNYAAYLERPDTSSLLRITRDALDRPTISLSTRGAAWAFLRYAADRSGRTDEDFFFDVVNAGNSGLANLNTVVGTSALDWIQDWTVSLYADDLLAGLDDRFYLASWNWRSIYENSTIGQYPLRVSQLISGQTTETSLPGGGAFFNRFAVEPGGRGVLHIETESGGLPSSLRGTFLRIR